MRLTTLALAACLAAVSGCTGNGPAAEAILGQAVDQVNKMADVIATARTVDEAIPSLEAAIVKITELKADCDKIKLSNTTQKEIEKKMQPEFRKAYDRVDEAIAKLDARDPAGMPKLKDTLKKFGAVTRR